MKLRSILSIAVAAVFAASCSVTMQDRRVADELYETPDSKSQQESYITYYDEAENILKNESSQSVDSVVYEEKASSANPYREVLVDNYSKAHQMRRNAISSPSYGMSDWYGTYYSDDFFYASSYDPAFYNVIVMGDKVWVEPKWLTRHFGAGYQYGSFYNYPYNTPYGAYNPYSSHLSTIGIYGFNTHTFGYRPFGFNTFAFGQSSFMYGSNYGYGLSSYYGYGLGSYYGYGFSPYMQDYYPNSSNQQQLNENGRIGDYDNYFQRYEAPPKEVKRAGRKSLYIRTDNSRKGVSRNARTVREGQTDRSRFGNSKYVRSRKNNNAIHKPRYNRPHREANYEHVKRERSRNITNTSTRKRNSSYRRSGGSNRSAGTSSSRGSSGRKGGSSGSSGSGSSGRKTN
jgi:uncharacterized membrane protein YgcG